MSNFRFSPASRELMVCLAVADKFRCESIVFRGGEYLVSAMMLIVEPAHHDGESAQDIELR